MFIVAEYVEGSLEFAYGYGKDGQIWRWTKGLGEKSDQFYWEMAELVPWVGY